MITQKRFLSWLTNAINNVGAGYFGFVERVYCYELYHQLRLQMENNLQGNRRAPNLFLHSELVKIVITGDEAKRIGVFPLKSRRSPDFILHEPNTANHQIAAMEVKADPDLSYRHFVEDIQKLSELRNKYHYGLVIFHCINVAPMRIEQHLTRAENEGLALEKNVEIILKSSHRSMIYQAKLGDFL